jgi:hypothetical protein
MRFGGSASVRISRRRRVLGRIGRWTFVSVIVCLALIGFLHLTRGTAFVTFAASLPMVRRLLQQIRSFRLRSPC